MHARLLVHIAALGPALAGETRQRWPFLGARLRSIHAVLAADAAH